MNRRLRFFALLIMTMICGFSLVSLWLYDLFSVGVNEIAQPPNINTRQSK